MSQIIIMATCIAGFGAGLGAFFGSAFAAKESGEGGFVTVLSILVWIVSAFAIMIESDKALQAGISVPLPVMVVLVLASALPMACLYLFEVRLFSLKGQALVAVVFLAIAAFTCGIYLSSKPMRDASERRGRIDGAEFTAECVNDELGFIRKGGMSEEELGGRLRPFWEETGVQPFVMTVPYRDEFSTRPGREEYIDSYFDDEIGRDDAALFAYFDGPDGGWWQMACGDLAGTVIDADAEKLLLRSLTRTAQPGGAMPNSIESCLTDGAEAIMP